MPAPCVITLPVPGGGGPDHVGTLGYGIARLASGAPRARAARRVRGLGRSSQPRFSSWFRGPETLSKTKAARAQRGLHSLALAFLRSSRVIQTSASEQGGELRAEALYSPAPTGSSDARRCAWADPKIRPYVPARYAACFESYSDLRVVDPVGFVDRLPPAARGIFQGKERTYDREETPDGPANAKFTPARCFEVTTAEALAVAESLSEAGFKPEGPNREVWAMGLHPNGSGEQIMLIFTKLLPHGMWIFWAG